MAQFRVMAEKTIYIPYFKVFDAPTMEDAERAGEAEIESVRLRQELSDLGWKEGDRSADYEVKNDATEALQPMTRRGDIGDIVDRERRTR